MGYDRFVGEAAHRQLTELYRALRLYVNCFQPRVLLQSKQRDGSKVHRTYDQAQTPLQRLRASGVLDVAKEQELDQVARVLDPVRLLQQLEHLQQALWRHAIQPSAQAKSDSPEAALRFEVQACGGEHLPTEGITAVPPTLPKRKRKERQNPPRPHDWRTRKDPFEGLWEDITSALAANPERTGVSLFQELQGLYPGRFPDVQVRTLQRGLQQVRARLLVTFDDHWTEEPINGLPVAPVLGAVTMVGVS